MIITVIRTVIMYAFVVLTLRLMGKRQIGELEPSELVVTIIISEIAAMPITNAGEPVLGSILAIMILLILEVVLSFLAYKNIHLRSFLYGRPSIFFKQGKIDQQEMKRQRFNLGDLMEEVRNSGAASLDEVAYIIMETNGNVSVILNAKNRPVTPDDINLSPEETEISYVIIDNGSLIKNNLKRLGFDMNWLHKRLKENHVNNIRDVFYCCSDANGKVLVIPKEKKK